MMKMHLPSVIPNFVLSMTLCVFCTSCKKTQTDFNLHQFETSVQDDLTRIWFDDNLHGHAIGGKQWENGVHLYTSDGGETWSADTLGDKILFDVCVDSNGTALTTGVDGNIWTMSADTAPTIWQKRREYLWVMLRGIAANPDDSGYILVGGEGYQGGIALTLNNSFDEVGRDSFRFELDDIAFTQHQTAFAVGYGAILRTDDNGQSWTQLDVSGDFFKAIFFASAQVGYVVGYAGSILKTTDGGTTWKNITDGTSWFGSGATFRTLYFLDTENGYVAGDNGTLWHTTDGGKSWDIGENIAKNVHFWGICRNNGKIWLAAKDGKLFWFGE